MFNAYIHGIGDYIPDLRIDNSDFLERTFYSKTGLQESADTRETIQRFSEVAGIHTRRLADDGIMASHMGLKAAQEAIETSGIDPEQIDRIIFAHNTGDITSHGSQSSFIPNLAAKVKRELGIKNINCVAYDLIFGCCGWIEGVAQATVYIESGQASCVLVIGADTISRITDHFDRDSMIFADGAGAVVMCATREDKGVKGFRTVSHCAEEADSLIMGPSNYPNSIPDQEYLKMNGRMVMRYALKEAPHLMSETLKMIGYKLEDIDYFLMHQANSKMVIMIIKRLFALEGIDSFPEEKVPLTAPYLGNNAVATVPTLLYELAGLKLNDRGIRKGDLVAFAALGSGMHASCLLHRF